MLCCATTHQASWKLREWTLLCNDSVRLQKWLKQEPVSQKYETHFLGLATSHASYPVVFEIQVGENTFQ
jgi:hypothetical protein